MPFSKAHGEKKELTRDSRSKSAILAACYKPGVQALGRVDLCFVLVLEQPRPQGPPLGTKLCLSVCVCV